MAEYAAKRDPNRCPTHPGELLRDVIAATGKSKTEIAALLGISRQHLYDILRERKPVSPATAVPPGKYRFPSNFHRKAVPTPVS